MFQKKQLQFDRFNIVAWEIITAFLYFSRTDFLTLADVRECVCVCVECRAHIHIGTLYALITRTHTKLLLFYWRAFSFFSPLLLSSHCEYYEFFMIIFLPLVLIRWGTIFLTSRLDKLITAAFVRICYVIFHFYFFFSTFFLLWWFCHLEVLLLIC